MSASGRASTPAVTAAPFPRLRGKRTTVAPAAVATTEVASADPSSTTTTSSTGARARRASTVAPTESSRLNAGTMATVVIRPVDSAGCGSRDRHRWAGKKARRPGADAVVADAPGGDIGDRQHGGHPTARIFE